MTPQDQPPLAPPQKQKSRAMPWVVGCCAVLLLVAIVVGISGYAFYRLQNARTTNKNTSDVSLGGETHTAEQPEASASPAESNSANSNQTPVAQGTHTFWETTAQGMTGDAGTTFTLACPSGGSLHSVWGSDVYTADSSVCTAAVHVGMIKFESGGTVTIELRPGESSYRGTLRNSVKSNDYGAYAHSFVLIRTRASE